jgi:hypothetical protein
MDREIFAAHFAKLQWGKTFCNGRKLGRGALCKAAMGKNCFAVDSAISQWEKTFPRWTLQIHNGEKLFRSALCKSKMEEISFAVASANPQWTQHGQNGGAPIHAIPRFRYSFRK